VPRIAGDLVVAKLDALEALGVDDAADSHR
jgi:hypothetical protein